MPLTKSHRRSPYQGLIPYTEDDAPFFFGRENETRLIVANLFASPLTLLYGASGVGKSSVLRAGVAKQLRARDDLLVIVVSSWQHDPSAALKTAVAEAAAQLDGGSASPPQSVSMLEYLAGYSRLLNRRLMIILDQFEEYFLYHPDGNFDDELASSVMQSEAPISFLIAIREDCYAKLDRFEGRIPILYDNYLRIEHLNYQAARDAIEKPIEQYNLQCLAAEERVSIEPELIEAVLQQVQTGKVIIGITGQGETETSRKGHSDDSLIETPYLQLVMTRLWDEEQNVGSKRLRLSTLRSLNGAQNIVRTHLDAAMDTLDPHEQDIAAHVFHYLVTPSGNKIAYSASDLAASAELNEAEVTDILGKLSRSQLRILRPIDPLPNRPAAERHEIFHDVLAPAVLDWRARYMQLEVGRRLEQEKVEAQRQAEEQRHRAEEQARAYNRLRKMVGALLLMFLLATGMAVYAIAQRWQAQASEQRAVMNERKAVEAKQIADQHTEIAKKKTVEAEQSERQANDARAEAEAERTKAEAQTQIATALAAEAVKSRNKEAAARRVADTMSHQLNVRRLVSASTIEGLTLVMGDRKQEALQKILGGEALIGQIDSPYERAWAQLNLGGAFKTIDNEQKALQKFEAALKGFRALRHQFGESISLYLIAEQQKGAGEWQMALANYEQLLTLARATNQSWQEVAALESMAGVYTNLYQWQKALDYYDQVATLNRKASNSSDEADALEFAAGIHNNNLGNKVRALELYNQTSKLRMDVSEFAGAAEIFDTMGGIYYELGEVPNALNSYKLSREMYKKAGMRSKEAGMLQTIGYSQNYLGETTMALESYEQALSIYRELGDRRNEATVLNSIGQLFAYLSKEQKALEYYMQALKAWHTVGDRLWEAATLGYIGRIYLQAKDRQAIDHLSRSLQMFRDMGHRPFLANAVSDIAAAYAVFENDKEEFEMYQQASEIYRQVGDRVKEAEMLDSIGMLYDANGERQKALDYYEQALSIVRTQPNRSWEIDLLNSIGEDYVGLGEKQKGLDFYGRALSLMDSEGLRKQKPLVLVRIGRIYETLGNREKASEFYRSVESIRP